MLAKLLKYDLRSMLKTFLLVWGAALVLALVNHFTIGRLGIESTSTLLAALLKIIPLLLYIAILVAMAVLTLLFVIQRFYNGLLKDEGYLMFTLPVKTWELITSKGISAVIINLISGIVAVCSIMILIPWDQIGELFRGLFEFLRDNELFSGGQMAVLFIGAVLVIITNVAKSIYQIYAAIALGHLFKKHRVGMAFVMYLLINIAISTIGSSVISAIFGSNRFTWEMLVDRFSDWSVYGLANLGIWFLIVLAVVQLVVFHIITERILAKKLNLE